MAKIQKTGQNRAGCTAPVPHLYRYRFGSGAPVPVQVQGVPVQVTEKCPECVFFSHFSIC